MILGSYLHRYALVVGNGRSGTNWLLTMLNASEKTYCRNEPQHITSSPLNDLPSPSEIAQFSSLVEDRWNTFIEWSSIRMGERDHRIIDPKDYIYPFATRTGMAGWTARPKIRKALSLVMPDLRKGEWQMPWWVGNSQKLSQAYTIFKLNDLPAWTVRWLLEKHPEVPIIHIIRHPGGQLYSGISRFFSRLSESSLEDELFFYRSLLQTAVEIDPHWSNKLSGIDEMDLYEAVSWFWCYNNREIYLHGQDHKQYKCIIYEDLAKDPIGMARSVYDFCDLPWNREVEEIIASGLDMSVWGKIDSTQKSPTEKWKTKLAPENISTIQKVLEASELSSCWG